jgi:hypothetical protein
MAKQTDKPQTPEAEAPTTARGGQSPAPGTVQANTFQTDFGALQPLADAHQSYMTDLSDILSKTQEACTRENEQYMASYQEAARNSDAKGMEAAWQRFANGVKRAWVESQRSFEDAYRAYTERFRSTVSGLDTAALDPTALASIGNAALVASQHATSTIGNWNLFCSCGVDPRMAPIVASLP